MTDLKLLKNEYIYCTYGVNIEWILVSFLVLNLIIFLDLFKIIGS